MRYFALILFLPLFAQIEEEAFFLRRIADFWQEGEYGIAKSQMEAFLKEFPQSQHSDLLRISLGDILLREKNYSDALASYAALSSPEFVEKALLNRMQCLYNLEWYATLADECEECLKSDTRLEYTFYLAIALYHQCLNASKEPETLLNLAKRAEPYFETLLQSELSSEVSQAFAHLCCILKDFQKAADIYLDLAQKDPLVEDDMTFQAALIQAEYDKALAMQSFEKIAKKEGGRAKEAVYNRLILSFEAKHYEELVKEKEALFASIPEEKRGMAHLFLGRSLLGLKKYSEAVEELTAFLSDPQQDSLRTGLLSLIEAAYNSGNGDALDRAIARLSELDPRDKEIPKGRLLRAKVLKQAGRMDEAAAELKALLSAFPDFPELAAALFERIDLEYRASLWEDCRSAALAFLETFPKHELSSLAWRYVAAASNHLSQEQFTKDLEALLQKKHLFPVEEAREWEFYLAQSYYNLGRFDEGIATLKPLLETSFPHEANAHLLLGLCFRDGHEDQAAFCLAAERAISKNADLMEAGPLHLSLFNAYLELSKNSSDFLEKSRDHLFQAFTLGAEIAKDNLLWLGDCFFDKQDREKAARLYSALLEKEFDETATYRLGKLFSEMGRVEDQIGEMEKLSSAYASSPDADWKWEKEATLLLAEGYEAKGMDEKAIQLLGKLTGRAIRSETIAKACLAKARISARARSSDVAEIAREFKDLILQRRLENEPIHLEAALEYVDLLASNNKEKRLSLLEKIRKDFESADDLLSKDYAQARLKSPDKNRIFEEYMRFIEEEILMAKSDLVTEPSLQKELQAKAKDLLLQIKSESLQPPLLKRVNSRLQNGNAPVSK